MINPFGWLRSLEQALVVLGELYAEVGVITNTPNVPPGQQVPVSVVSGNIKVSGQAYIVPGAPAPNGFYISSALLALMQLIETGQAQTISFFVKRNNNDWEFDLTISI